MQTKRIFRLGASSLAFLILSFLIWLNYDSRLRTAPVVIRYIEDRSADGTLSDRPTFWVSNRTSMPLMVRLSGVQVRSGSEWTNDLRMTPQLLRFSEVVGKRAELIGPHQAEESMSIHIPPQESPWRVNAVVFARQGRFWKAKSDIRLTLSRLHVLPSRFDTNLVPLATLSGGRASVEFYRPVYKTVIEEAGLPFDRQPRRPVESTSSLTATKHPRSDSEAIARAREAMRQKLGELYSAAPAQPAASPSK